MRDRVVKHKREDRDYKIVSNFKHISGSVVCYEQNGHNIYYNMDENLEFNRCFSKISLFNEYRYALARIDIMNNDKKYSVFCFVNELGEVISPLINNINYVMAYNVKLEEYLLSLKEELSSKRVLVKGN